MTEVVLPRASLYAQPHITRPAVNRVHALLAPLLAGRSLPNPDTIFGLGELATVRPSEPSLIVGMFDGMFVDPSEAPAVQTWLTQLRNTGVFVLIVVEPVLFVDRQLLYGLTRQLPYATTAFTDGQQFRRTTGQDSKLLKFFSDATE